MRAAASIAIVFASCAPSVEVVEVPAEGARSVLFVARASDRIDVLAVDIGSAGARTLVYPTSGDVDLWVLEYKCPLDRLGFDPGALAANDRGGEGSPLPSEPRAIIFARVEGGESSVMPLAAATMPPELASIRLEVAPRRPSPCVQFTSRPIVISETPVDLGLTAALGGDEALVATANGQFFVVTATRAIPRPELSPDLPHTGAFRAPDGSLWLVSGDGRTVQGSLQSGFEERPARATRYDGPWMNLAGPRTTAEPFELFLASGNEALEHFDGERWETLDRRTGIAAGRASLARIGPNHAIAAGFRNEPRYLELENGTAEPRVLPGLIEGERAFSAAHVEGIGTLIGTSSGAVFLDGVRLGEIDRVNTTGAPIHVIAPLDDGLLLGGKNGILLQYFEGHAACELIPAATGTILRLIPLENGFLAVPTTLFERVITVTMLMRTTPPIARECAGE